MREGGSCVLGLHQGLPTWAFPLDFPGWGLHLGPLTGTFVLRPLLGPWHLGSPICVLSPELEP